MMRSAFLFIAYSSSVSGFSGGWAPVTTNSALRLAQRSSVVLSMGTATENWQMRLMEAYDEAEQAVEKYGVLSPEAKVAWEKVDDLELVPSSVTAEVPKGLDVECDVETDEQKCREFEYAMNKLEDLANGAQTINYQIKYHTLKLQNLKMGEESKKVKARSTMSAVKSPAYQKAKAEAEAANKEFGKDSAEAKVAWAEVFEIVSSEGRNERVADLSLEEECVIDEFANTAVCKDYAAKMAELQKALDSDEESA